MLAESAVSTNPGNAKAFATIGNVYAQQVRLSNQDRLH